MRRILDKLLITLYKAIETQHTQKSGDTLSEKIAALEKSSLTTNRTGNIRKCLFH